MVGKDFLAIGAHSGEWHALNVAAHKAVDGRGVIVLGRAEHAAHKWYEGVGVYAAALTAVNSIKLVNNILVG